MYNSLPEMTLGAEIRARLRCPACQGALSATPALLACLRPGCGATFPVVNGVPVLIGEERSVFANVRRGAAGPGSFDESAEPDWKRRLRPALPKLGRNLCANRMLGEVARRLGDRPGRARVLVVGGGVLGSGMEVLAANDRIELVEGDVFFGPRAEVLFDAHDIPFAAETFDAVIAQAVLEHVLDPPRCIEEFARVLKPRGLVYAETPFMQQVHGGAYDFTRFSLLGHRRLFRRFEEIDSGMALGPGTALAWSWTYFLASFCRTPRSRSAAHLAGRLTAFFWKWFDVYLARRPAALDAASGMYFLGVKGPPGWVLSDRDLIASYRGVHG
jgi:SAM-dependent methyltransferase